MIGHINIKKNVSFNNTQMEETFVNIIKALKPLIIKPVFKLGL